MQDEVEIEHEIRNEKVTDIVHQLTQNQK